MNYLQQKEELHRKFGERLSKYYTKSLILTLLSVLVICVCFFVPLLPQDSKLDEFCLKNKIYIEDSAQEELFKVFEEQDKSFGDLNLSSQDKFSFVNIVFWNKVTSIINEPLSNTQKTELTNCYIRGKTSIPLYKSFFEGEPSWIILLVLCILFPAMLLTSLLLLRNKKNGFIKGIINFSHNGNRLNSIFVGDEILNTTSSVLTINIVAYIFIFLKHATPKNYFLPKYALLPAVIVIIVCMILSAYVESTKKFKLPKLLTEIAIDANKNFGLPQRPISNTTSSDDINDESKYKVRIENITKENKQRLITLVMEHWDKTNLEAASLIKCGIITKDNLSYIEAQDIYASATFLDASAKIEKM